MTTDLPMAKGAYLSEDGRYRYMLWRIWSGREPVVGFIMLNHSTADAALDDPTIRRCVGFARSQGGGALYVANLFGLRSPHPKTIEQARFEDAVGPENDEAILAVAGSCDLLIAAWGAGGGANARRRANDVLALLGPHRKRRGLLHLGLSREGRPRHPLYLPAGVVAQVWR